MVSGELLCVLYSQLIFPLHRAVVTGKTSQYTTISSLKSTTFGISRFGSGSQVMASVMALQEGWGEEDAVKFEVKGKFGPLRDSVNSGESEWRGSSWGRRQRLLIVAVYSERLPLGVVHNQAFRGLW